MAYDFVVLSKTGFPEKTVSVNLFEHVGIFTCESSTTELSSFNDYYEDAEVPAEKLITLMLDLKKLENTLTETNLKTKVSEIIELVKYAQVNRKSIFGIAD